MKTKLYIFAALGVILISISILFMLGVGMSNNDLVKEELTAYYQRKVYTELSTPTEKASYAVGMSHKIFSTNFDGKGDSYLAPIYNIYIHPEDGMYYIGQMNVPPAPLNLKTWIPNKDMPLDANSFIAGYIQSMENKVLIPILSGQKGVEYLQRLLDNNVEVEAMPTDTVETVVMEEVIETED